VLCQSVAHIGPGQSILEGTFYIIVAKAGSYFPEFQRVGLEMIKAQGGIFGWVADSAAVIAVLGQVR
jgi:hypothetical protein